MTRTVLVATNWTCLITQKKTKILDRNFFGLLNSVAVQCLCMLGPIKAVSVARVLSGILPALIPKYYREYSTYRIMNLTEQISLQR